jgi:hypothetical protein
MLHTIGIGILLGIGLMLAPIVLRLVVAAFIVGVAALIVGVVLLLMFAYPMAVLTSALVLVALLIKGLDMFEDHFWPGKRQRRLDRHRHC